MGGGLGCLQILKHWVKWREAAAHEGDVSQNAGQQVVEVVGHPTCQFPDGFHLLGLAELSLHCFLVCFRTLALGDVFYNMNE